MASFSLHPKRNQISKENEGNHIISSFKYKWFIRAVYNAVLTYIRKKQTSLEPQNLKE
ncbi:hypothetical protein U471_17760 [Bacillus amyloliquefaciens CC178]|nr:hypothetical protein U471_17760 [Bacillus amyloliquefaciens CC178]